VKTMTIEGVKYVEAPETDACEGCAFMSNRSACSEACNSAKYAFGHGYCATRAVIYIRAEEAPKQSDAMAELLKARDAINAAIAALEAAQ